MDITLFAELENDENCMEEVARKVNRKEIVGFQARRVLLTQYVVK